MKTFRDWWDDNWLYYTGEDSSFAAEASWEACKEVYEHKMRNMIQAKDMKIAVLERQLREYAKTPHEDVPTHQRESDLGVSS